MPAIGEVELSKHCKSTFHVIIIPVWMSPTGLELRHKYLAVWSITAKGAIFVAQIALHSKFSFEGRPIRIPENPRNLGSINLDFSDDPPTPRKKDRHSGSS